MTGARRTHNKSQAPGGAATRRFGDRFVRKRHCGLERMDRQGQHYVLIDREFPGLSANFVGIDDEAAGRIATEHLLDPGCKTIGHMKGPHVSTGIRRFEGY
jgi:DNA-binding LacI/PurR family transcriptional regulator